MIIFGSPTENADWIIGDDSDDLISGLGGDDYIVGNGGADRLLGNEGDDTFVPGLGKDQIWGGSRTGDSGNDTVSYVNYASAVFVDLAAGYGYQSSLGNNDRDTLHGIENVVGSAYEDEIHGDAGANRLSGRDGSDSLYGGAGNDQLYGGNDRDYLVGGAGADAIDGGAGADRVDYSASASRVVVNLAGGFGLYGDAQGDSLVNVENVDGSRFDDVLTGDASENWLSGFEGDDHLNGGGGNDTLIGEQGDDALNGGGGDDLLAGGSGKDRLTGGGGTDWFVFGWVTDSGATTATSDVITDFNHTQNDKIHLGYVDANDVLADDQAFTFIGNAGFSNTAGELRYGFNNGNTVVMGDVDGDGAADFRITLTGSHALTADDFVL